MENKISENNIEAFTYEIAGQSGWKRFLKKVVRKLSLWLIQPIGDRQNSFNRQASAQIGELCVKYDRLLQTMQIQDETLKQFQEECRRLTGVVDSMERNVKILRRPEDFAAKNDIDVMEAADLREQMALLKEAGDGAHKSRLEQIRQTFSQHIEADILRQDTQEVIAIVCSGLKENAGVEAIRKEVLELYTLLRSQGRYTVLLFSMEEQTEISYNGTVIFIPEDRMEAYFATLDIRLLIAVESDLSIMYRAKSLFFKYKALVRLTGQNPLAGVKTEDYEHLLHLNDLGLQRYQVYSKTAKALMDEAGFKRVEIVYPALDLNPWNYHKRAVHKKMSIGFASAPMGKEQWADRGINLLSEIMADCPEYDFIMLWRDKDTNPPEQWEQMQHCTVLYGRQDMQAYYEKIDVLLIPYTANDNNHACSFSALEAMLQGIPVISTSAAGVADILERFGIGEICGISALEMKQALQTIESHYDLYHNREKSWLLRQELLGDRLTAEIGQYARAYQPSVITTIGEWRRDLELAGKTLVKGPAEIKAYYSQFEIAEHYHTDRFIQFPENCIDLLERTSIGCIIQDRFKGQRVNILDIAPGDGRIMQEDLKYGDCLGVDSSEAMLRVMRQRFQGFDNLKTKALDYFESDMKEQFDVITTFRYIRHFEYAKRKLLYQKIKSNMTPKGILIFDVPNIKFEMPVRSQNGWDKYNIYDIFTTKEDMAAELEENGFHVEYMIAIGSRLMENIPAECTYEPITWTFGVTKA